MTTLRGRAANPIRTGMWIKKYLLEYGVASITDMHRALRNELKILNSLRKQQGVRSYRAPTYESFGKYVRNLAWLGLVAFTGEEKPMELPPPGGQLLSIRKTDSKFKVVPSTIRLYALTPRGIEEDELGMWADPTSARKRLIS